MFVLTCPRLMARRWGGLIGALSLFFLFRWGFAMDFFGLSATDAPFGRGLWWTFDVERLPVLSVEGFLTREEANAFVVEQPDKRSCIPEAVAVSLGSIFAGLVPSGQLEFHWVGSSRAELN